MNVGEASSGVLAASPAERGVVIAGLLAEAGVTALTLRTPAGGDEAGSLRELRAREVDLPSEVARAAPGTVLTARDGAVLITLGEVDTRYTSSDAAFNAALARARGGR